MLPVEARELNELVQNRLLFGSRAGAIPLRNRLGQFAFGRQTQLPPDFATRHVEFQRATFS